MSVKKVVKKKVKEIRIEAARDEPKGAFVTAEELAKLSFLQHSRDREIQQLGLDTLAWQQKVNVVKSNIDILTEKQASLGKQILCAYGCDSDKENFTIDLQTGKIIHIGAKG